MSLRPKETVKKGRVYQCVLCGTSGNKRALVWHVLKVHAPFARVPFTCTLCHYRAQRNASLRSHANGKIHTESMHRSNVSEEDRFRFCCTAQDPYLVTCDETGSTVVDLYVWSREESDRYWQQKTEGSQLELPALIDSLNESTIDASEAVAHLAALPESPKEISSANITTSVEAAQQGFSPVDSVCLLKDNVDTTVTDSSNSPVLEESPVQSSPQAADRLPTEDSDSAEDQDPIPMVTGEEDFLPDYDECSFPTTTTTGTNTNPAMWCDVQDEMKKLKDKVAQLQETVTTLTSLVTSMNQKIDGLMATSRRSHSHRSRTPQHGNGRRFSAGRHFHHSHWHRR